MLIIFTDPFGSFVMVISFWCMHFVPLKSNSSNCYTTSCRPNLPFSFSDIRALWRSALVPECQIENGRLDLHGTEHLKCNHLITLSFKGLCSLYAPFSVKISFWLISVAYCYFLSFVCFFIELQVSECCV